jgi:hypothetical protein
VFVCCLQVDELCKSGHAARSFGCFVGVGLVILSGESGNGFDGVLGAASRLLNLIVRNLASRLVEIGLCELSSRTHSVEHSVQISMQQHTVVLQILARVGIGILFFRKF